MQGKSDEEEEEEEEKEVVVVVIGNNSLKGMGVVILSPLCFFFWAAMLSLFLSFFFPRSFSRKEKGKSNPRERESESNTQISRISFLLEH